MKCMNCGETMSGDGIKSALHCPSLDASDREPDADPLHCDALADDHPLWLVNAQILGLLDGDGASEDHENVSAFLRGTGLPASTVERMRQALCRSAQATRKKVEVAITITEIEHITPPWPNASFDEKLAHLLIGRGIRMRPSLSLSTRNILPPYSMNSDSLRGIIFVTQGVQS